MMFGKGKTAVDTPETPAAALDPDAASFPRRNGNGHGTHRLFTVEIRLDYATPTKIGDFVVDREWRTLPVAIAKVGVPNKTFSRRADEFGLFTWEAANALRWWAHASLGLCLQSRIVEHKLTEQYSDEIVGYHDVIGGGGSDDRTRMAHGPLAKAMTEPVSLNHPIQN